MISEPIPLSKEPTHLKLPFFILTLALFILFSGMRFYQLTARPMHNDEAVNGWFLDRLVRNNEYRYDPENYHGPSLYYLQLAITWVSGLVIEGPAHFSFRDGAGITDVTVRLGVVLASLLLLAGVLFCAHRVGPWGSWGAFVLLGLSCHFLYFSRYFIHEMWFALFNFGLYWTATLYQDTRRGIYFYLFALSAVLLYATKETSLVNIFVMGFSVLCAELLHTFIRGTKGTPLSVSLRRDVDWLVKGFFQYHVWAFLLMGVVWMLLYTSFFTHRGGLADSVKTYFKWTKEGVESGHNKPVYYWMWNVLIRSELPLLIGAVGGGVAACIRNEKKGLYLLFWTLGMIGAYSVIPYKTIWCVLSMLVPMALLSGYGLQSLLQILERKHLAAVGITAFILLNLVQIRQTLIVNYRDYDKEYYEAPYVHTSRDVFTLSLIHI